jgi:hypothetical protein
MATLSGDAETRLFPPCRDSGRLADYIRVNIEAVAWIKCD